MTSQTFASMSGKESNTDPALVGTSSIAPESNIIRNPFIALKGINPRNWPQDLTIDKEICWLQDQFLPRGKLPKQNPGMPPLYCSFFLGKIRIAQQTGKTREILYIIPELLDHIVRWLCNLNEAFLEFGVSGLLVVANDRLETATCPTGAAVNEITVYHYIDAHHRHAFRAGMDPSDVEPPYTEQDADHIDIYDLSELLLLAQNQMYLEVPTAWNDGNYTVHIIYPDSTLTRLIVITAHIPHETALAVQEGHSTMKMIRITRDIVDIDLQADDAQFMNTDLFRVLVGMVEHGIKVAKMTPD
ncbi:hypothetical protein D9615_002112 [Tricholomella constricta]|uniref:Uncharacterized protein n=1 Tax=Tricholomella constricta TaxID=117010 RepID=A0A8H5HP31_9AGAR|nr:hypothetical protein D9615_002112 [Tricholomella constricta]